MASGHRGLVVESLGRLFDAGTLSGLSDGQLLERFIGQRDESAFEAILSRYGPMVLGVCGRVLAEAHDVDDAFQATFLVLVKRGHSIRKRDVLGTWLHGVARRVAVRARTSQRRRRLQQIHAVDALRIAGPEPQRIEADELRAIIDDELGRLSQRYRAALVLCDLEGKTHEQAAEQLRCPVGTIKSRLARGRERLRSGLVRRGLAPSAGLLAMAIGDRMAHAVPAELLSRTLTAALHVAAGKAPPAGALSAGATKLAKSAISSMTISKLFAPATALLVGTAVAIGGWMAVSRAPAVAAKTEPLGAAAAKNGIPSGARNSQTKPGSQTGRQAEPGSVQFDLANGLHVILRPIKGASQTALAVVYSIGSDHDPAERPGLGHLLEHLYVTAAAGNEPARIVDEFAQNPETVIVENAKGGSNRQPVGQERDILAEPLRDDANAWGEAGRYGPDAGGEQDLARRDPGEDLGDIGEMTQEARQDAGGIDRAPLRREERTEAKHHFFGRNAIDGRLDEGRQASHERRIAPTAEDDSRWLCGSCERRERRQDVGHAHTQQRFADQECVVRDVFLDAAQGIAILVAGDRELDAPGSHTARFDDGHGVTRPRQTRDKGLLFFPVACLVAVDAQHDRSARAGGRSDLALVRVGQIGVESQHVAREGLAVESTRRRVRPIERLERKRQQVPR
jgi:RNA polymerase sigma factor (sigma-70 family)